MIQQTQPTQFEQQPDATGVRADVAMHQRLEPAQWRALTQRGVRREPMPKNVDAWWDAATGRLCSLAHRTGRYMKRANRIVAMSSQFQTTSASKLREHCEALRATFRRGRESTEDVDRAFAVLMEVAFRAVGMRPYPVQVAAGLAMEAGCCCELATGEGKTLVATLPATIAGWRGRGCHVITVNDYLAERDAKLMKPLYQMAGVSVAFLTGETPLPGRRAAYAADVTYTTNNEAAADYLRDQLALQGVPTLSNVLLDRMTARPGQRTAGIDQTVMRGLACAIIDEADSVLIDEAVTPLIISGGGATEEQMQAFVDAAGVTAELESPRHYRINHRQREITLTRAGRERAAQLTATLGGIWRGARRREELIVQALTAREFHLQGKQYVVQDEKVVIVDEFTGRLMPDRTWRDGLHQAVEAKEGLEPSPLKETLARISFQRFFRNYQKLSAMTGTAWEARHELWQTYHLTTVRIPTNRPCIRRQMPDRPFATRDAKWAAVVEAIERMHREGRPVLVGTRSVQASEHLSGMLTERGLDHQVLNAVRHAEEAQIVAQAGQPGRITVATNMAGRGTDIKLGRGVAEAGGLHVVAVERNESGRIDRQLVGRAGRQGDPGSAQAFICLEDELLVRYGGPIGKRLAHVMPRFAFHKAQQRAQRIARQQRAGVLRHDEWLEENLGFTARES